MKTQTEPDKILFLDCDGVLNDSNDLGVRSGMMKDPSCIYVVNMRKINYLKTIIKETGCKIVLSSVWRLDPIGIETLEFYGVPIFSTTPQIWRMEKYKDGDTYQSVPRGEEIKLWMEENRFKGRYAIVDDDSDMLDEQRKFFFQTDPDHGLTKTIAWRIARYLNHDWRKKSSFESELA